MLSLMITFSPWSQAKLPLVREHRRKSCYKSYTHRQPSLQVSKGGLLCTEEKVMCVR